MSNFTLLQPNKNSPSYNTFSNSDVQEVKNIPELLQKSYQFNVFNTSDSFFTQNCNWEYFSNELEFE